MRDKDTIILKKRNGRQTLMINKELDPIRKKFLELYLELQFKEREFYKNYNPLDELEIKDKKDE